MARIARVRLEGFKSRWADYDVAPLTALTGPMGAGKSACAQAIRYALTGEVEDGKADAIVAPWFAPEGGFVVLYDDEGRWLKRGLSIDRGWKGRITRILESSDTKEGGPVDLSSWRSNPILLDIAEFEALSAERKRRFVLELCGDQDRPDGSRLIEELELGYVRGLGGRGAERGWLYDEDKWSDFDPREAACFSLWGSERGILEQLQSHISAAREGSISEVCAKLIREAAKERSAARKIASDARGAANELKTSALEARALAERLESRERDLRVAESVLGSAKTLDRERRDTEKRLEAATRELQRSRDHAATCREKLELATSALDELDKPSMPQPPDDHAELLERARLIDRWLSARREFLSATSIDDDRSEMVDLAEKVRSRHPSDDEVVRLCELVTSSMAEFVERRGKMLEDAQEAIDGLNRELGESAYDPGDPEVAREMKEELQRIEHDIARAAEEYNSAVRRYESNARIVESVQAERDTAKDELVRADAKVDSAAASVAEIEAALGELGSIEGEPDLDDARLAVKRAKDLRDESHRAKAACDAYDDATRRVERHEIEERAWKVAESAIKQAREKLVHDATAPLREDMDAVLEKAGRDERVFVRLQNERGTPEFEMGLTRGGDRIGLGPLSGGESTLFLCALAIAIALRSEGHRVITVEADHLDRSGLESAFEALVPWSESITFVLCTSREVPSVDGWTYRRLSR